MLYRKCDAQNHTDLAIASSSKLQKLGPYIEMAREHKAYWETVHGDARNPSSHRVTSAAMSSEFSMAIGYFSLQRLEDEEDITFGIDPKLIERSRRLLLGLLAITPLYQELEESARPGAVFDVFDREKHPRLHVPRTSVANISGVAIPLSNEDTDAWYYAQPFAYLNVKSPAVLTPAQENNNDLRNKIADPAKLITLIPHLATLAVAPTPDQPR